MATDRMRCVSSPYQVVCRLGWMRDAGLWAAMNRAVSPDQLRFDAGLGIAPLGGLVGHVILQLVEPHGVGFDVGLVETVFADDHVHPGQEEGDVGSRLDGQPISRLARGGGKARIHHHQLGAPIEGRGQFLHLGIVHVLPQVASDQGDASGVLDIDVFRGAHALAIGQPEPHFPRTAALGVGRRCDVGGPMGHDQVLEPGASVAVGKQGQGFGSVFLFHFEEVFRYFVQGLFPRNLFELLFAPLAPGSDQRFFESVRIIQQTGRPEAPRTEPAF